MNNCDFKVRKPSSFITSEAAKWPMFKGNNNDKNLNTSVQVKKPLCSSASPGLAELEVGVWIPELIPALSCPASEEPQGSRRLQRPGSPL